MASKEADAIRKSLFPRREFRKRPVATLREELEAVALQAGPPKGVTIRQDTLGGVPTMLIEPEGVIGGRMLFLCHGGGFILGSGRVYLALATRIARAVSARLLLPEYRLAPEHPYPAAVDDVAAAYHALGSNRRADQVAVLGDSAGGALAAGLLMSLRDAGQPMPHALALLSPWLDLSLSGESYETRRWKDPIEREVALRWMADMYVADSDRRDPRVSPAFGSCAGLPPTLIQAGDHEVLLSDAQAFAEHARAAGVDVTLEVWPEMWHAWHFAAPGLPEANEAIESVGRFLDSRFREAENPEDSRRATAPREW